MAVEDGVEGRAPHRQERLSGASLREWRERRSMKRYLTLGAVFFLGLGTVAAPLRVGAQSAAILAAPKEPRIDSPRLAALWQELKAGNAAALDSFWREIQGKAPLIEPNPADPTKVRVTFIVRGGDNIASILLGGGLPVPS